MGFFSFISNPLWMSFDFEGMVWRKAESCVEPTISARRFEINWWLFRAWRSRVDSSSRELQNILHNHLELIKERRTAMPEDGRQEKKLKSSCSSIAKQKAIFNYEAEIKDNIDREGRTWTSEQIGWRRLKNTKTTNFNEILSAHFHLIQFIKRYLLCRVFL